MSDVLDYIRESDPKFKDASDDDLTGYLADKHPDLLAADPTLELQHRASKGLPSLQPVMAPDEASDRTKRGASEAWRKAYGEGQAAQAPPTIDEMVAEAMPSKKEKEPTPEQSAQVAKSMEDARRLEKQFQMEVDTSDSDPRKIALARQRYVQGLAGLGIDSVEDPGAVTALGRLIGPTMARSSKVTQAALADVMSRAMGLPADNLKSFAHDPDGPLPIELMLASEPNAFARVTGKISMAMTGMVPVMGAAAGAGMAGASHTAANALAMGFDPEGNPDPVGLVMAVGLPITDALGRKLATDLIVKRLRKTKLILEKVAREPGYAAKAIENRFPTLERNAVQQALEVGGGQLLNNAFLLAVQTPGILAAEDPSAALEDALISNLAISIMGAGELARGRKSQTRAEFEGMINRGEMPFTTEVRPGPTAPEQLRLPPSPEPTPPASGAPPVQPAPPAPASPGPVARPAAGPVQGPVGSEPVFGKVTTVRGANDSAHRGVYAWVPAADIAASHGPDFAPDPRFAPLRNTRRYESDPAEQEKVLLGATNWDPHSYTTNTKGASEGPIIVSRAEDGQFRVLGGNGRMQMIQRLSPEQREAFGQIQDDEAAVFGLPGRPSSDHLLVRVLPPQVLASPEGVESANRIVDLLNPSAGLVESTSAMARNDASKITTASLAAVSPQDSAEKMRAWVGRLIGNGTLDRNTRTQIAKSDAQLTDYVQRLITQGAYHSDEVVEFRQNPRTTFTVRGLIDAGAQFALQLRMRSAPELAASFTELIQRVAQYQEEFPGTKLDDLLKQIASQKEGFETPAGLLSRNLAAVLASKVERLPANRRGERKMDPEETVANFGEFLGSMARSVEMAQSTQDLFGNTRSPVEVVQDFLRANMGDGLIMNEPSANYGLREPDPKIKRLNKLMALRRQRALTKAEEAELVEIEANTGQDFLAFHREHTAKSDEAEKELQRRQIEAKAKAKLVGGSIESQGDIFGKPPEEAGGQLTIFEPGAKLPTDGQTLEERSKRRKPGKGQLELALTNLIAGPAPAQQAGPPGGVAGSHPALPVPYGPIRIHARAIAEALINFGGIDVVGQYARTPAEAAALFQTIRQPQFEVFSIFPVKAGKIVDKYMVSARIPNSTYTLVQGDTYQTIRDLMARTGADSYWCVHNHPSGTPIPSAPDKNSTRELAQEVAGFLGHIVTDHTKYGLIQKQGRRMVGKVFDLPGVSGPDPFLTNEHPLLGSDVTDVARMAASFQNDPKRVSLIFLSADGKVRAMASVGYASLTSPDFQPQLRAIAAGQGALSVVAFYADQDQAVRSNLASLVSQSILVDAITPLPPGGVAWPIGGFAGMGHLNPDPWSESGWMGKPYSRADAQRLAERPRGHPETTVSGLVIEIVEKGKKLHLPVVMGGMEYVHPVEFPELVKIAKMLTGAIPGLKKLPRARGYFRPMPGAPRIVLNRNIFVSSAQAAKTLAHEIGHATDFWPDETMERGNILGRMASLKGFLAQTLPLKASQGLDTIITPDDRQKLRQKAEKKVGPRPADDADRAAWSTEVSAEYAELLLAEIESRGLVAAPWVTAELWELSQFWRPLPEGELPQWYLDYRKSSKELYADAISVLYNSPSLLAERVPLFNKLFWEYLDRKPNVKAAMFAMQDFLQRGKVTVLDQRATEIEGMFTKGEEIMKRKAAEREARRVSWKGYKLELDQEIFDTYAPVVRKVQQAEAAGVEFSAQADPRNILEEGLMVDNVNARFVRRIFEGVVQPLEAAGISVEELGRYLFLRRIQVERRQLGNPLGITPEAAREGLLKMRLDMGMGAMTTLEAAVDKFHGLVFESVQTAVEVGSYSQETFDTIIKPNRDVYAAFAVLDYLEDFIPAGIRQQVGTLKDIANPFTATVLKTVSLNNLNMIQRSKNATRDLLTNNFPGEIEKAQGRFLAPGKWAPPPNKIDRGILSMLEDGKLAYYYVDPLISHSFEHLSPQGLHRVLRVLDTVFRKGFYPMFITYSPSFLMFNPARDFQRTWLNMPKGAGLVRLGLSYAKTFGDAVAHINGGKSGLAAEMVANHAIGMPWETLAQGGRTDQFGDMMRRYHLMPEAEQPSLWTSAWFKPIRALHRAAVWYGTLQETLPKMAGYHVATRHLHMPPKEAAAHVRNYVGTPNIFKKGRSILVVRAFFPFFNVFAQGWRSDLQRMRPKSGSGWLWKWAATDGLFAMLSGLAAAGLLGAALKALFGGASEYDKTNYNVVPIGWTPGGDFGKQVDYLRFPRSESSRLLSGMTYKLTRLLAGDSPESFTDLLDFGAGSMPSVNPAVQIPLKWTDYFTGHNPEDSFRGRPIIPRTEFQAGGWDSFKPMLKWTLGASGVGNFVSWNEKANTTTELVISAIPGLNKILKTSDFGYGEEQRAVERTEDAQRARHRLAFPESAQELLSERSYLMTVALERRTPEQAMRYEMVNTFYNSVYRPADELAWTLEQNGDKAKAQAMRDGIKVIAEAFAKPKAK